MWGFGYMNNVRKRKLQFSLFCEILSRPPFKLEEPLEWVEVLNWVLVQNVCPHTDYSIVLVGNLSSLNTVSMYFVDHFRNS